MAQKFPTTYQPRTIQQVLDELKVKLGVSSDYKLALTLGIGETALANYRKNRSLPDATAALKMAQALNEEPSILLMEIEAQRAKTEPAKVAWQAAAAFFAQASVMMSKAQKGFSDVNLLAFIAIFAIAFTALPAWASGVFAYALSLRVCILC